MSRVVIVTGASEGIGRELSKQLAARGDTVVVAARNRRKLDALIEECADLGGQVVAIPTDVGVEDQCEALITQTIEDFGRIDVLVCNAGISMSVRFDEVEDTAMFERLMRVNYLGTVWLTYYALEHLKASRGLLVGVSSLQGKFGFPRSTGYAASKHAVQGFLDSLRIELVRDGVGVLVISPGAVDTEIHSRKLVGSGDMVKSGGDYSSKSMPVPVCARIIVNAIDVRRREVVMTWGGKLAVMLRPFLPGFIDRQVAGQVEAFYASSRG